MSKIIFLGNGPLADYALDKLKDQHEIIFHARTKDDLATVKKLKLKHPDAHGILASFGVMIKQDLLDLFEPEGILNIHPSLLPEYRGPSPIETAMKNGEQEYGVSIMKLVKEMDAGPVYWQTAYGNDDQPTPQSTEDKPTKDDLYNAAATLAAFWLNYNLDTLDLIEPGLQETAPVPPTYTTKLDKSMSPLDAEHKNALQLLCEIRAFQGFPKSTAEFFGKKCIIHSAHLPSRKELRTIAENPDDYLTLHCKNGTILIIDELQPENKKRMPAKAFLNGYKR